MAGVSQKTIAILFLLCGVALLAQTEDRLRADPPGSGGAGTASVCPMVDLSTATMDCQVSSPCELSTSEGQCLTPDTSWAVESFPKECLRVDEKTQCNEPSQLCKTYLDCEWDFYTGCTKKAVQPVVPKRELAKRLKMAKCP